MVIRFQDPNHSRLASVLSGKFTSPQPSPNGVGAAKADSTSRRDSGLAGRQPNLLPLPLREGRGEGDFLLAANLKWPTFPLFQILVALDFGSSLAPPRGLWKSAIPQMEGLRSLA